MSKTIKDDIKIHGVTINRLAKELGISEDRVTAMNNNPVTTPVGRIVESYDYMGETPTEIINSISNNEFVLNKLELSDGDFLSTRERIGNLIKEFNGCSDVCKAIKNAFETVYKYPLIYITGSYGCGKTTMAENLLGTTLKLLGSPVTRSYMYLLLMSERHSGIAYNYPFGEYPYSINSSEHIPTLLTTDCTKEYMEHVLKPISSEGIASPSSYAVYSNSSTLDAVNIICSDSMNMMPNDFDTATAAETDAQIINMADIMIIMLDPVPITNPKLFQLLQCSWERWGNKMTDHIVFVISKSDRYSLEEIEIIKQQYQNILKSVFSDIANNTNDCTIHLNEEFANMIFSYSSIKKKNKDKIKSDASHNGEFYKRVQSMVQNMVFSPSENKNRKSVLSQEMCSIKNSILPQNILSKDMANNLKIDIKWICTGAENYFANNFSSEYKKIISSDNILNLIHRHNITKAGDDKRKLISLVNSQLNHIIAQVASSALLQIIEKFKEVKYDVGSTDIINNLTDRIMCICYRIIYLYGNKDDKQKFKKVFSQQKNKSDAENSEMIGRILGEKIGMVARNSIAVGMLFPISMITPIVTGAAGASAMAYYAQTNFEKNTAKKIVSLYNTQNIEQRLSEEIITKYFVSLKNELIGIVESSTNQGDKQTIKLIDNILEITNS